MSLSEIVLIILYSSLFSIIIYRSKFFNQFDLLRIQIIFIFIVKIAAGIFYGYLHRIYYGGGDTMEYFYESKFITDRLAAQDYNSFYKLLLGFNHRPPADDIKPYALAIGYWNDMSSYFIIRFHGASRLFSFGFYNVHVVFYNFITLIGTLFLFQFILNSLKVNKYLVGAIIFFFPSVLFFCSGIHKDGLAVAAIGAILFFVQRSISFRLVQPSNWKQKLKSSFGLLFGVWLLLIVRDAWLLLLLPSLFAFILVSFYPKYSIVKYLIIYIIYIGIASNLNSFLPQFDFLNILVLKQNEFLHIPKGNHPLTMPLLIPAISSIIMVIPRAISNCILEPGVTGIQSPLEWMASLENVLLMGFGFFTFFERKKKTSHQEKSFIYLCLFFSLSIFIVSGITVPILGALVRYKMTGVLFLLVALTGLLDENNLQLRPFKKSKHQLPKL